jgi:hypothetical protein
MEFAEWNGKSRRPGYRADRGEHLSDVVLARGGWFSAGGMGAESAEVAQDVTVETLVRIDLVLG